LFNKQSRFLIPALLFFTTIYSQPNLIPNNSFETISGCPNNTNQLNLATNWQLLQSEGTPDLYCYCATNTMIGVPRNLAGFQCPNTGYNYAGYSPVPLATGAYNEILGIKLSDSLLIGTKYYASFKISLSGEISGTEACSHHGLKLTTKPLPNLGNGTPTPTNVIINNFAHIYSTQLITDTTNWVTIKGSFVADSNYKYVYFGVFFQQSNVTYTVVYGSPGSGTYYYIDDVCLSTDSNTCKIPTQATCFPTGIDNNFPNSNNISIYPQPTKDILNVNLKDYYEPTVQIKIIDLNGKETVNKIISVSDYHAVISTENLANGVYILQIQDKKNQVVRKKLIIGT
jgi:hypothetical protein